MTLLMLSKLSIKSQEEISTSIKPDDKNPSMKYEHVIHRMWKVKFLSSYFPSLCLRKQTAWICWMEVLFSLVVSKNSNKAAKHKARYKDWRSIRENDRAIYQQPVSTCNYFSFYFVSWFFQIPLHASEIKMKNWGGKTYEKKEWDEKVTWDKTW